MPTKRLLGASLLLVLASSIAVLHEGVAPFVLATDATLALLFVIDLVLARRTRWEAKRAKPGTLVQGVDANFEVTIEGPRAGETFLRDTLHPGVAAAPQRTAVRPATGRATWTYSVRPRARGRHRLGPLVLRVPGPMGLALSQKELLAGEEVRVLPQIKWEGKVGHLLSLAHRRQLGQNPLQNRGVGYEPYALRQYLPGDPRTKIHWKASARRGHLVSREDSWERGARLTILLDCGRSMAGIDGDRGKLDWALAATMALVRVAAARGDHVTVIAFAERVLRTVRVRPGTNGAMATYAELFDLQSELSEPAYEAAAALVDTLDSRRAVAVLMTSVVDIAAAESVRNALTLLRKRHRPILVNLEDPDLHRLGLDPGRTPVEAIAKAGALGIIAGNRRMAVKLRHAGVSVASVSAKDLASETLMAYLQRAS